MAAELKGVASGLGFLNPETKVWALSRLGMGLQLWLKL